MKNIVLIGMSGCGKTTVGKVLATRLSMRFYDMDKEIEKAAGKTITQIFAEEGEAVFRDYETDCARRIAKRKDGVIATGGGVVLRPENMEVLGENSLIVWLDRSPEEIVGEALEDRPLLAADKSKVGELYQARFPLYQKYGQCAIKNKGMIAVVVNEIITAVQGGTV